MKGDPWSRSSSRLALALANVLWAQERRAQARALAQEALAQVAEIPERRADIEAWLRSHPGR